MKGLLTSILTVLTFTGLQAQTVPAAPKLVIGLTIDQLRTDYIETFSPLFGEKGFKRLWKEGRVYKNAQHTFATPDRASAIAAIHTGTTPSVNGIIGETWFDQASARSVGCVDDPEFLGYYSADNVSASRLLTSTIADELKIATQGKALVYSIAPFKDAAVFGAGHAGDAAIWLNDITGKWGGSTYYGEFPIWLNRFNDADGLDTRIAGHSWSPSFPLERYTYLTSEWGGKTFKYIFDDAKRHKFKHFMASPFVNDEINLLVDELLKNSTIGKDNTPDMLALTYYAGNYNHQSIQEAPVEMQDTYVKLDRSIATLLELVERKIGLHNVLFFITSTGYADYEGADLNRYRIPGGDFHLNRCAALLNMYLMATYGEGQYIKGYQNQQIYLDHELIEKKQLRLFDVQSKAADFLIQFSGVNEVYSAYRLLLGTWTPEIYKVRNAFNRKRSGDLIIDVLPGWKIADEQSNVKQTVRYTRPQMPLIFIGNSIRPEIIQTPVTIDRIAPTVAHSMRIRAPNGCSATPITE